MQASKVKKNQEICKILGKVVKELSKDKKKSILAYECDLPRSVVHYIIEGIKDPQLTTFWRLALGLGMRPSELMKILEEKLPDGWDFSY
ncbi:helix-turn-helix transcriptional regulator [bacterium]|nr:helix-turn-helix transcriptional regulator [bacterium]